jgi:hypothetical protein
MFRLNIKYILLLFSFASAIPQEKQATIILYNIEGRNTRINMVLPPLYINLNPLSDVGGSSEKITLRFHSDEENEFSDNISWNIQKSEEERLWYLSSTGFTIEKLGKYGSFKVPFIWTNKIYPFIRQKSIREHISSISQNRGSYTQRTNDHRYQDFKIEFKSILQIATQRSNNTINLDDLPIKLHGPYSGRLIYSLGHQDFIESEYKIVASYITPKWNNDYVFTQSRDSLYNIDLRLYVASPSIIRQDWSIKLSLPIAEEVIWDRESILTELFSISNIADSINYKWLSPTEIVFRPKKTFRGNSIYILQDLPIRTNRVSSSVKIKISLSPYGKEYYNFGRSQNGLKIVQPKIIEDLTAKKTFITLYKENENLIIPSIIVDEGPISIPREILPSVSLVIPDSIDANWATPQLNFGGFDDAYERESKRKVRYDVSRLNFNGGQILLKSAELINHGISMDQIRFDVDIHLTTTSIRLPYPLPITIGQPKASAVEDNIVLGSSNEPIIQRLYIYEDPDVKTLGVGDTISYILRDNGGIEFDPEKIKPMKNYSDHIEIHQWPKQYDRINFIIKKEVEPGDTLRIFNLPLKIYDKKSRIIHSQVEFRSVHGTRYLSLDHVHIEIVNVNIDFSKTTEYYPKSPTKTSVYELPSLTIQNDGSVDILHEKSIKIRLESVSNYQFEINNLLLESSQPIDSRDIRVIGDQIEISFPSGLDAQAFIKIGGIGLKLSADHALFYNSKLLGNFGAEKNYVTSTNSITYGSPSFESPFAQKLVAGGQDGRLYSIACDFGNMSQTFKDLEDIIFRLPSELDMSWDPNMDLSLVNDNNQVHALEVYVQNFGQDIRIHIDRTTRERLQIERKFDINGLRIRAPLAKQLSSFQLSVSIDQGQTFAILVSPGKEIIKALNRAAIDQQRVREDYYPFTVGKEIVVGFNQSSSHKWDVTNKLVKYSDKDKKLGKNVMFFPDYSQNSSRSALKAIVKYDIDHQPSGTKKYRMMEYGVNVTLSGLLIEGKPVLTEKPNIHVTLNTLYGPIAYENSNGMYQIESQIKDGEVDVTIGLKTYPKNDMLSNDFLINWYRYPERYKDKLHLDPTDTLAAFEREEIVEDLNQLRKELNYYYSTVGEASYFDWVYWYYTAWYKKRMQDIRGSGFSNFNLSDIQPNSSSIYDDIQNAARHGYNVDIMKASFPSPLDTTDASRTQELAFQQAKQYYSNGEYIRAEDLLYENFDESGMENYLLVSYYTLFGQIAKALNDQSEFYNKALDRMESFECIMYALARKNLDTKHTRSRLLVWDKNLYSYIQNIDCTEIDDYSYPLEISTYNKEFQSWQLAGTDPMSLSVMWLPNQMVSLYDLEYMISHYPVIPREGENIISYESIQKELIPFNQELEFYGGNTYTIEFNDTRHPWKRSLEVSGATAMLIFWGLR